MKHKTISNDKTTNYIILFLVIVVIAGIAVSIANKKEAKTAEKTEESAGSGFLDVDASPSNAHIFLDNEYVGESPTVLYNIPAGQHEVAIKKDGYEDFTINVEIEAGKKAFIQAELAQIQVLEEKEEIQETAGEEKIEEELGKETPTTESTVNVGNRILLYYDFSEKKFTDNRQQGSDVFSKRFDTYLLFTRYNPVNIKVVDKSIDSIKKEDCADINDEIGYLHSGQSLCIVTKESGMVALGGEWDKTENAELEWKMLN
ncbi:PEGA domain-containing protein [Candidatus Woesearchaeota archaeon]|nr:PEGA domain-containing protein [Candidatus Woesearchaeota archaeon]